MIEAIDAQLVPDLSNAAYHSGPEISASKLHHMAESMAAYYALDEDPERPPPPDPTEAMIAGTLLHCLVLEPKAIAERYLVRPDGLDMRTKDGKAWAAENLRPGLELITPAQFETACGQRRAIMALPEVASIIDPDAADSWSELSMFWTDPETGVRCRCRPDRLQIIGDGRVIPLDLKTTSKGVSPEAFARQVWTRGHHVAQAHYTDGVEAVLQREVAAFLFVAVTAAYPFIAVAYMLDDEARLRGVVDRAALLRRYVECKTRNEWPAYGDGPIVLSLPRWAR